MRVALRTNCEQTRGSGDGQGRTKPDSVTAFASSGAAHEALMAMIQVDAPYSM